MAVLKGYKTESEEDAKARLSAAGWDLTVDYEFKDADKSFHPVNAMKEDEEDDNGA